MKKKYSKEDLYIKIRTEQLKELLKWRKLLPTVLDAIKETLGDKPVYLFGSAAENKLTVDSDIDIAIILEQAPNTATERAKITAKIWEKLEKKGIPFWYPIELHLLTPQEKQQMEKAGTKFIKLHPKHNP